MDLDEEGVEENEDEGEDEDEDSVEDDSDEDVEDDDDDDEGDDEEANALRKTLAVAMGADAAFEEEDESTDGSDEESMDDEQMMQIDEKLAAVFRNRVEEKKKGKSKFCNMSLNSFRIAYESLKTLVPSEKQHTSRIAYWISWIRT